MTKMRSTHPPLKPLERKQGSPHCFFGLPPTDDNPIAFVDIKANYFFFTHPPLPEVWPTARTFGSLKLAFSDPHSLIEQSLKVHFECKLDYNFVLLRSYVVLSLTSSLVYDSASMC